MIENIFVILLPCIFFGTFITRNLIVKAHTKKRIRASDPVLKVSIIFTNLCIFIVIFSTYSEHFYRFMGALLLLRSAIFSYIGLFLFAASIAMGWTFSAQLKGSWRIGVHDNQKNQLIQSGIYEYVRNPYFLSYFVMFFGLFLIRPSMVLAVVVISTILIFHRLVLKEEAYLLKMHGEHYEKYKKNTGRYIPRFK